MKRLSGRFSQVEKIGNKTVVGLLGNIEASSLNFDEKNFIAHFYNVSGERKFSIASTYETDKKSTKNFNSFLVIEEV